MSPVSRPHAKGAKLGRPIGARPADTEAKKVLELAEGGFSYRLIGRNLGMSKNTVMEIIAVSGSPRLPLLT